MTTPLAIGIMILVLLFAATWSLRGTFAKVAFSLLGTALVAQGCLGALHAWGEGQDLPWTAGWLSFAILFGVLVVLRWRRP